MNPSVSILIPTYNQDLRLLKECVDSALSQTVENFEVVVSDNHSTNGTHDLLNAYDDYRLKVLSPEQFVSMNENFAFCAKHASGEYISFLSSDDALLPNAIEELLVVMDNNPKISFGFGNIYRSRDFPIQRNQHRYLIRKHGTKVTIYSSEDGCAFFFPWRSSSTWMAGNIIRRSAYENTGGFLSCNFLVTGDVWLTSELLKNGGFFCLDKPLALFRTRTMFHKEVDSNRIVFQFLDGILIDHRQAKSTLSRATRFKQQILFISKLGALQTPTSKTFESINKAIVAMDRDDLLTISINYNICPLCYILISRILASLKMIKTIAFKMIFFLKRWIISMDYK